MGELTDSIKKLEETEGRKEEKRGEEEAERQKNQGYNEKHVRETISYLEQESASGYLIKRAWFGLAAFVYRNCQYIKKKF
jgi:hypothetical protein